MVLDRMSALMSRNADRCNRRASINRIRKIQCHILRVKVIRQVSCDVVNSHGISHTICVENIFCRLCAGHSVGRHLLTVLIKRMLAVRANDQADHQHNDRQNKTTIINYVPKWHVHHILSDPGAILAGWLLLQTYTSLYHACHGPGTKESWVQYLAMP